MGRALVTKWAKLNTSRKIKNRKRGGDRRTNSIRLVGSDGFRAGLPIRAELCLCAISSRALASLASPPCFRPTRGFRLPNKKGQPWPWRRCGRPPAAWRPGGALRPRDPCSSRSRAASLTSSSSEVGFFLCLNCPFPPLVLSPHARVPSTS